MSCPNGDDSMSSGPRTAIGIRMYGTGAARKAGYPNGSDGAAPPSHVSMFSRECFDCHLSLLNSLRTCRGMLLTDLLEHCGGLFLNSASTLFFRGGRSGSGELLEDNSSSTVASLSFGRIGSLPLFFLTRGTGGLLPRAFYIRSPSR